MMAFLRNRQILLPTLLVLSGLGIGALAFAVDVVSPSGDGGFGVQQQKILGLGVLVLVTGLVLAAPFSKRFVRWVTTSDISHKSVPSFKRDLTELLMIAVWFGMVAGLVEGFGLLVLTRYVQKLLVWVEILWISPVVDVILFSTGAILLALLGRLLLRIPLRTTAVGLAAFFLIVDWLILGLMPWPVPNYSFLILAVGLTVAFMRWYRKNEARNFSFLRRNLPFVASIVVLLVLVMEVGGFAKEQVGIATLNDAPASAPNILVIVVDTLRADHVGAYGYGRDTTPNIDRLAAEGVVFESAFATSSWTAPSHASMLTGTYMNEHDTQFSVKNYFLFEKRVLPRFEPDIATLPETLRERGYMTAAFSANHWWFTRELGFGKGFMRFEDFFHSPISMFVSTAYGDKIYKHVLRPAGMKDEPNRKIAEDINEPAMRWMDKSQDKPFFIFINYLDAHDPYKAPGSFRNKFSDPEDLGAKNNPTYLAIEQRTRSVGGYDSSIAYVDFKIGELLSHLDEQGLDDNLLVIITSDHGEAFGEHGVMQHANSLYKEEIYVPLIFWQPGQIPENVRIDTPVSIASIPATIDEVLNGSEQLTFPAKSVAQLWQTSDQNSGWPLPLAELDHWYWKDEDVHAKFGTSRAIISPDWHLIEHETLGTELYNWPDDPAEKANLAQSVEGQGIIDNLRTSMQTNLASR